ncbi:hypothetical protein Arnit_1489 [Arcobacter nitrofigilis DSM 7299]|uniref:Uncharacterized protein n=1 Tax=Arcobacter nitrofigilis (strain ATCC 33309 / DSM 7299 / CCUG 15893 / LMG 7604 / NCTC 12251 / CI) TaxID=572480 RepID=D5V5X8_ARCNC|nr:ABC-three component system middle component 4 [Arcobacter nitrofigilis]ADG93145.1 hypothetical protein Arnit_1489 [Arcobacter nitrofigilis DSM 7299]
MFNLPFIIPDDELELNLIILVLIVDKLSVTSKGNLVLDGERIMMYFYLVKNPHILNKLLILLSKKNIQLKSYELASFKAENTDIDTLYDNKSIKKYLQILISKELIAIKYSKKIGFIYTSAENTRKTIQKIDTIYLKRVLVFINKLEQTISIPISKITTNLKQILNEDN